MLREDKRQMEKDSEWENPITEGEKYCKMFDEMSPKDTHAEQKEKYATGKYDCYVSGDNGKKWQFVEFNQFWHNDATYKLIKQEHSHIANAVIANPDVEIKYKISKDSSLVVNNADFFESYDEDYCYGLGNDVWNGVKFRKELAKPQSDEPEEKICDECCERMDFPYQDCVCGGLGKIITRPAQTNSIEDIDNLPTVGEDPEKLEAYMAKKAFFSKQKKETIRIESKWQHKDGGTYIITGKEASESILQELIFYGEPDSLRQYCRTKSHFLESFTPIKKQWHEDRSNFPALLVDGLGRFRVSHDRYHAIQTMSHDNFRLATKEEVQSLYYQDKEA